MNLNCNWKCYSLLIAIAFFLYPSIVFSQTTVLKGRVLYKDEGKPAAFVDVSVTGHQGLETMTSYTGNFSIQVPDSKNTDVLVISAVGYETISMPLHIAAKKSEFTLSPKIKSLSEVTVFNSHQIIGSMSESVGYYRSWRHEHTGGEIGRIFKLPHDKFVIDKIRFKAGNLCDTCLLRLRIREVVKGEPGEEILTDSISIMVNKLSLDSKVPEFDLTPYNIVFTENEFFVGIEVLNCKNGTKGNCSFNFAGTEKGEYFYKSTGTGPWKSTDDYTIYLKLFLRF